MSTDIAVTNSDVAIEVVNDKVLIDFLDAQGLANNLTMQEKTMFLQIAKASNLNPFKREIYVSKYNNTMAIITGYEVYLKRAERSGLLNGWHAEVMGSLQNGDLMARVTIYRKDFDKPFVWEAYYDECVQRTRDGHPTKFWQNARFMTKKVAIAQGFRLAFPLELGGMPYTSDEMAMTEDIGHVDVSAPVSVSAPPKTAVVMDEKMFGQVMGLTQIKRLQDCLNSIETGAIVATEAQYKAIFDRVVELELLVKGEK